MVYHTCKALHCKHIKTQHVTVTSKYASDQGVMLIYGRQPLAGVCLYAVQSVIDH